MPRLANSDVTTPPSASLVRVGAGEFAQVGEFVSPEKCEEWRRLIFADRVHWAPGYAGWVYGEAFYVKLERGDVHGYFRDARAANDRVDRLPGFLDAMRGAARHLVGPDGELDLPTRARRDAYRGFWTDAGVHIHCTFPGGIPHADYEGLLQHPELLFDDKTRAFSCVLCLAAPLAGGELKIWKRRYLADEQPDIQNDEAVLLPLRQGTLIVLDSYLYHQILPGRSGTWPWAVLGARWELFQHAPCYRITAVTHFLFRSDPHPHWEYWF